MPATRPLEERFWEKISPEPNTGCWIWIGCLNAAGYGGIRAKNPRRMIAAHRFSFELENGPIQPGLDLDHICRVRSCVNPRHLRACTRQENVTAPGSLVLKKHWTHCKQGHLLSGDNLYMTPPSKSRPVSYRQCVTCKSTHYRRIE